MRTLHTALFALGTIILVLGIQCLLVDSFVLNDSTTRYLAEHFGEPTSTLKGATTKVVLATGIPVHHTLKPAAWVGFALVTIGAVVAISYWPTGN